ncbi:MAG: hypothetical protein ACRYFW_06105 [Janthinobacterium lividum]
MSIIIVLALALQAAAPSSAAPPTDGSPEAADERCLAAFADLTGKPGSAQAGRYGTLFFYGKLVGRHPGLDLSGVLPAMVADVRAHGREEVARCSREMQTAAQALAAQGNVARGASAH